MSAKLYKATLPSVNYIFKNGKPAIFVRGKFATEVAAEIEELDFEIAAGHPHIYVDKDEPEADSGNQNLLAGLRAQLEAEIRAEMAAASSLKNDMGNSEATKLIPASTVDIAAAALGAGPATDSTSAKLLNLKVGK
jgi:hypothetical protein